MVNFCKIHGESRMGFTGNRYRCKACLNDAITRKRQQLKKQAVDFLGGCCRICSYNKCMAALEFHHTNPNEKDFSISSDGNTRSWDKIKTELEKCILVCANCHRELHAQEAVNP